MTVKQISLLLKYIHAAMKWSTAYTPANQQMFQEEMWAIEEELNHSASDWTENTAP